MQVDVDYVALAPELTLGVTVLVVLVLDLFLPPERKWWAAVAALLGLARSLMVTIALVGGERAVMFGGTYVVDAFAVLFKVFFLSVGIVVVALSLRYFREGRYYQGEYYFLILTSFLGMLTISSSRDMLMLFISLEVVSAPGFLMAGFRKRDPRSNEAALKFFLIGILSTAVMLYGMSLIYGITGTLRLDEIAQRLGVAVLGQPVIGPAFEPTGVEVAAVLFVVAGFAFKVSSVPFHFWAPDTYEGSPVPVAAFLSVASKAAGFAGLIALMFFGFGPLADFWAPVFAVLSILTMTIGNLVALQQRQVVRLLAYSSIAQAGYMLLPFALAGVSPEVDQQAVRAAIFYILVYAIMNLGAFAVVVAMSREAPGILVSDFAGMGRRAPAMAVAMLMFFVSLAGIPPTPGFWGKLFIFQAAIAADQAWLAVVMVVNSVISVWYYFSIIRPMFFVEPAMARPFRAPALVTAVVVLASAAVVVLGVLPGLITGVPTAVTLP
jgi:NADH-quinone oxidoreductase subunit N